LPETSPGTTVADCGWVVGIDIGGIFTDAIAISSDGKIKAAKVVSTPADPGSAFQQALLALADAGVPPQSIRMIFHGTTVATNALLTGRTEGWCSQPPSASGTSSATGTAHGPWSTTSPSHGRGRSCADATGSR